MIDYEDYYYNREDDVMPFTGWAIIDLPWTAQVTCQARIRVGADLNNDGELINPAWVDDVDWIELHTFDGFRKGKIEALDLEDHAQCITTLFESLPMVAQTEKLSGVTLSDIDDRELVVC